MQLNCLHRNSKAVFFSDKLKPFKIPFKFLNKPTYVTNELLRADGKTNHTYRIDFNPCYRKEILLFRHFQHKVNKYLLHFMLLIHQTCLTLIYMLHKTPPNWMLRILLMIHPVMTMMKHQVSLTLKYTNLWNEMITIIRIDQKFTLKISIINQDLQNFNYAIFSLSYLILFIMVLFITLICHSLTIEFLFGILTNQKSRIQIPDPENNHGHKRKNYCLFLPQTATLDKQSFSRSSNLIKLLIRKLKKIPS